MRSGKEKFPGGDGNQPFSRYIRSKLDINSTYLHKYSTDQVKSIVPISAIAISSHAFELCKDLAELENEAERATIAGFNTTSEVAKVFPQGAGGRSTCVTKPAKSHHAMLTVYVADYFEKAARQKAETREQASYKQRRERGPK